jgi:two-component system phosphate regulon sensor histidine kinase PhoR
MPRRPRPLPSTRRVAVFVVGMVVLPAILSLSVGIIALTLWREGFDIAFGVLVLSFGAMAIAGGVLSIAWLRQTTRIARLQAEFVGNVSHELKTPLAGIRLMAETLALGRADDAEHRREVLDAMEAEIGRLEALVDRLLRWRRIEEAAQPLGRSPQPVEELVEAAVERCQRMLREQGTKVVVQVREATPAVMGDRDTLVDALGNLVENALKFGGDRGPVEVIVRPDGDDVVFEVRDQGPGIAPADSKRIFDRFYRSPVHLRSRQGSGLGLAIVRGTVLAHGGRLHVESVPGIGSVFFVRLPAAPVKEGRDGQ